jgi:hypothetical protein
LPTQSHAAPPAETPHPTGVSPLAASLFSALIDYAGLFPPAALSLTDVVRNYAAYRHSPQRWILGRLILPIARLDEFAALATPSAHPLHPSHLPPAAFPSPPSPWPLSILAPNPSPQDALLLANFRSHHSDHFLADVIETKSAGPDDLLRVLSIFSPREFKVFVEIPLDSHLDRHLDSIARHSAFAKVRTGGLTPDLFLPPAELARFLHACATRRLAFKATAGLHHLLPATRPLTYASDSPCGPMHGFLNLFAAAALLFTHPGRFSVSDTAALLSSPDLSASGLQMTPDSFTYRGLTVSAAQAAAARKNFAIGFGSCSFDEPIADLHQAGLLP